MIDTQGNVTPHINTGECRDPNRAMRIFEGGDIRVAYIMGESHVWIDHALAHCDLVCVRIFDMFNDGGHRTDADATIYTRHTKEEVFHRIDNLHRRYRNNPRVKWVIGNEPSHSNSGQFSRKYMLDWHADVGRYMAERGYATALGGIAMAKTNGLPFRNGGDWNKILTVCAEFPEWVSLDIHEYAFMIQAAGHLKTYYTTFPEMYLDRQSMHPDNWGDIDYENGNTDDNWHLGNVASLSKYNREVLGYPQFWYGRGECGFDYVVEQWWKDWVDLVYIPKYGLKPEGMHNLKPYWADILHGLPLDLYTDVMYNRDIILNASYLKRNSGRGCLYNAHFSYNTNPYWVDDDISRPEVEPYIHWMEYEQHTVLPLHVIEPNPEPIPEPTPIPVPIGTIDLLPYLRGDGRIYDMHYTWSGGGIQRIQTQTEAAKFFQVKGHPLTNDFEWEELWADETYIYRGTDVSPSPTELYQVHRQDGTYGERWFHRFAKVGDTLRSVPKITFRYKATGVEVPDKPTYTFPHWIEFTYFYPRKGFNSGITLDNVVELTGYMDDNGAKGQAFEVYYYAKDYGLVAWKDPLTNRESYIAAQGIDRPDLPRLKLAWLTLPDVPDNEPVPDPDPERIMNPVTIEGWNNAGSYPSNPNIRAAPTLKGAIVGSLPASPVVTTGYVSTDAPVSADGYTWQYYSLLIDKQTVSGYIATQLVRPVEDVEKHYDFALGSITFSWTLSERDDIVSIFNIAAAILDSTEPRYAAYADDIRTFASAIDSVEGTP